VAKFDVKRHWQPNEAAFQRLLAWLDEGTDSEGARYLDIHDRLAHYFARRNCFAPHDLADETLNRVARRLEERGSIDDVEPAHYCYIMAKFVLLEALRHSERQRSVSDELRGTEPLQTGREDDSSEERERTMACLERCLSARSPAERALILDYYRSESGTASAGRKRLADRLGLTANSLAIRAWRIRSRLEACVRACLEQ